jgi:hypothetical protein
VRYGANAAASIFAFAASAFHVSSARPHIDARPKAISGVARGMQIRYSWQVETPIIEVFVRPGALRIRHECCLLVANSYSIAVVHTYCWEYCLATLILQRVQLYCNIKRTRYGHQPTQAPAPFNLHLSWRINVSHGRKRMRSLPRSST